MTRIIRDIRFGTRGNFFNSRSPPKIFFSLIIRDSQVPSCSRLAPLPAPVHYAIGHRVRIREHCSRLSCTQSGLPTGHLDVFPETETVRVAPRTVAEVTELVRQAVEPRLTIESFPSRPPAPQRGRRSRYKSRLDLRAHIRTCRIIRDPNNSRS